MKIMDSLSTIAIQALNGKTELARLLTSFVDLVTSDGID